MELLEKQETICKETGFKQSLKLCYERQIEILEQSGNQGKAKAIRARLKAID